MTGKTRAMRPLSGEKGAKRCDSRHFCTVIVSNQLIISRKVREIIMKIGAYCRNRRPICPIRPNDHAAILAVPTSATAASTARGIAKNGVTTLSAAARGYDARWQRARKIFLSRYPLCAECQKNGILTPATVVDHIIPHRGDRNLFWDENNWQPLCKSCHDRKTGKGL